MKLSLLGWACAGVILLGGSPMSFAAPAIDNGVERARPAVVAGATDQIGEETATFCLFSCSKKKVVKKDLFSWLNAKTGTCISFASCFNPRYSSLISGSRLPASRRPCMSCR